MILKGTNEDETGKGTNEDERNKLINLLHEYRDVLAFSYDELKGYREDVMEHTIPLKDENAKLFQQKLTQINPKLAPLVQNELTKMLDILALLLKLGILHGAQIW